MLGAFKHVADLAKLVTLTSGRWFYLSKSDAVKRKLYKVTGEVCAEVTQFAIMLACLSLQAMGLGMVLRTAKTVGGGRANWFFVKRIHDHSMTEAWGWLGVTADSTPSLTAYIASLSTDTALPPRASDPQWLGHAHTSPNRAV